jgi:hypothetical protein
MIPQPASEASITRTPSRSMAPSRRRRPLAPHFGAGPFSSGQHHDTLGSPNICPRETTMAEAQDNSPEYIAYRLMRDIAETEGKYFRPSEREPQKAITRKWILETYAECLMVVKDPHNIKKQTQKS